MSKGETLHLSQPSTNSGAWGKTEGGVCLERVAHHGVDESWLSYHPLWPNSISQPPSRKSRYDAESRHRHSVCCKTSSAFLSPSLSRAGSKTTLWKSLNWDLPLLHTHSHTFVAHSTHAFAKDIVRHTHSFSAQQPSSLSHRHPKKTSQVQHLRHRHRYNITVTPPRRKKVSQLLLLLLLLPTKPAVPPAVHLSSTTDLSIRRHRSLGLQRRDTLDHVFAHTCMNNHRHS
jgi:hypothetical protein